MTEGRKNEQEFSGTKFDQDKPRVDLLDTEWLEEVGRVMGFGAKKYAAHNWRSGISISRLLGAALRHLFAIVRGEDIDSESGFSHIGHLSCTAMFLYWTLKYRKDLDDRYKSKETTSGPITKGQCPNTIVRGRIIPNTGNQRIGDYAQTRTAILSAFEQTPQRSLYDPGEPGHDD